MVKRVYLFIILALASVTAFCQISPEVLAKREKRKNLTVKEWNTDSKAKLRWLDHVTTYDAEGRKVEEIEYATYGQRERVTFEYDETTGKVVKEVVYNDRNNVERIRKYEWNENGTKAKQYNYLPNGKLYSVKVFEYIFND
jgi:antitoxin component YwqK of YwqJK toxin-antitoxin module